MKENSLIKLLQQQIISCLLPYHCFICEEKTKPPVELSDDCLAMIIQQQYRCQRCAKRLSSSTSLCGNCISHPPYFDKIICLGDYDSLLKDLIIRLKFQQKLSISKLLGLLLSQQLKTQNQPQALIAVPLPRRRLAQRGFNQAFEIAKTVSKTLAIPLDKHLCQRQRYTPPQTSLPAKKRAANVRNAFKLNSLPTSQHIAIIDDVVTTGSTVNEISSLLKAHGVTTIEVWCIARA